MSEQTPEKKFERAFENNQKPQYIETQSTEDYLQNNQVSLGDIDIDPMHTVLAVSSRAAERSQLREKETDGRVRRRKDMFTHGTVLTLIVVVALSSAVTLHSEGITEEREERAYSTLATILVASVGYIFGKESSSA